MKKVKLKSKIVLGLATLTLGGILSLTTITPAYAEYTYHIVPSHQGAYNTKKITISPVDLEGNVICGNIEIDAKVVDEGDGIWYTFEDPYVKGYEPCTHYRIENAAKINVDTIVLREKYRLIEDSNKHVKSWVQENGVWYYKDKTGEYYTGWLNIGNEWYFLDKTTNAMRTGWIKDGDKWYYCQLTGEMAHDTVIDGYTLGSDGAYIVKTSKSVTDAKTNTVAVLSNDDYRNKFADICNRRALWSFSIADEFNKASKDSSYALSDTFKQRIADKKIEMDGIYKEVCEFNPSDKFTEENNYLISSTKLSVQAITLLSEGVNENDKTKINEAVRLIQEATEQGNKTK